MSEKHRNSLQRSLPGLFLMTLRQVPNRWQPLAHALLLSALLGPSSSPGLAGPLEPTSPAKRLPVPASYEGESAGANGPTRFHLDLLPGGHFFWREISPSQTEATRPDRIGRWQFDRRLRQLKLRRGEEDPLAFAARGDGAELLPLSSGGGAGAASPPLLRRLARPAPVEPRLRLAGVFLPAADAASIVLDDGWWLPVAREGEFPALEQAYRQMRGEEGQPLRIIIDGTIATRPSLDDDRPPRQTVVVNRFLAALPGAPSPVTPPPLPHTYWKLIPPRGPNDAPLRNTYWRLVLLEGEPVDPPDPQHPPYLLFAPVGSSFSGGTGCNRLMGSFHSEGERLSLGLIGTTRMACPSGGDLEQVFLEALPYVERYRIVGSRLDLFDNEGIPLASFEAAAR